MHAWGRHGGARSRRRGEPSGRRCQRPPWLPARRPPIQYGPEERDRIVLEFRRRPDRERDGTATWSLTTLQRALRRAPDGLPKVSTYTIWAVLHEAGITWQRDRTWCQTGIAIRKRKRGEVKVQDPDASAKKVIMP
jgi:transposase